jgi:hypothetical protein
MASLRSRLDDAVTALEELAGELAAAGAPHVEGVRLN